MESIKIDSRNSFVTPKYVRKLGRMIVINLCDYDLLNLVVKHINEGHPHSTVAYSTLAPLQATEPSEFYYSTDYDGPPSYWNVSIRTEYLGNFNNSRIKCNLKYKDDGYATILIFPAPAVKIIYSYSGSCYHPLYKNT